MCRVQSAGIRILQHRRIVNNASLRGLLSTVSTHNAPYTTLLHSPSCAPCVIERDRGTILSVENNFARGDLARNWQ